MNLKHTVDTFRHGSPDCDTVVLLCMDEEWKNVVRVYIIPSENIEKLHLAIYTGTTKVSKWDEFRVDEEQYNDTYSNLDIENCTILRKD